MPSRRRFLAASAATLAAAALPKRLIAEQLGANAFTNASLGAYAQGLLTEANFQKQVGSVFTAQRTDGSYGYLTLRSAQTVTVGANSAAKSNPSARIVISTPPAAAPMQVSTFALIFDVQGPAFDQGTYVLDHGILGSFAVFLVPGATPNGTPTCLATFSSLVSAAGTLPSRTPFSVTAPAPTLTKPTMLVR
jgi:hypothetical protein